jgi:hypothetical protein
VYMYTRSSQYRDAGWAKEIKFGTAVNAVCHWLGNPWSFIHIPWSLQGSEPYGYRNGQQTVQLYDYSNVIHGLILCPMVLLLYPLWIN